MATSQVSHTVTDGSGTAVGAGHIVEAVLMPSHAFRSSTSTGIARRVTTTTNASGAFVLPLERQANIVSPSGTWWRITIKLPDSLGGPQTHAISVGASDAVLLASLVTPSSSSGMSTYITQAAGDARYLRSIASIGVVNVKTEFGAVGDGVTDDTASIQAAIDSLSSRGGIVFFPPGIYIVATALNCDDKRGVILAGAGQQSTNSTGSAIHFSAGGASSLLSAKSVFSFRIENLYLRYTNAAFTGSMVDVTHSAGVGADSNMLTFANVSFDGVNAAGQTAKLVNLDKAIIANFSACFFTGGGTAVIGKSIQASYANAVSFYGCTFQNQAVIPVNNPGEAWSFFGCCWEAMRTGKAGAIAHDTGVRAKALTIIGCWTGDVTVTTVANWFAFDSQGVTVIGNAIQGNQTGTTGIRFDDNGTNAVVIKGNLFNTLLTGVEFGPTASHTQFDITGNYYANVTTELGGTLPNQALRQTPTAWDFGGMVQLLYSGAVQLEDGDRYVQFNEVADPAAPGANRARLYVRDNGAGKSQLCARFNSGAVQVIATEP